MKEVRLTEYQRTRAFLIACELDEVQARVVKAMRTARRTGRLDDALPAMKARDLLVMEYEKAIGGRN